MFKYLLLVLCIPQLLAAQEPVKPVISADYISLINNDSLPARQLDTAGQAKNYWQLKQPYTSSYPVRAIRVHGGQLSIVAAKKKYLTLGGNFTSAVAIKTANAMPLLQNEYVQGESAGGVLTWQGPETGEVFSYGPSLHSLGYDGKSYAYDVNGRLVKAGTGSGKSAVAYNNSILKNGYMLTHAFCLLGNVKQEYSTPSWAFSLKAATTNQSTVIQDNNNTDNSFSASLQKNFRQLSVASAYSYFISRFSNDNSTGFLNRVYQNALLTPVSFDNAQGYVLPNASQRSYSNYADNPQFLLKDNGHSFSRTQQTGNVSLQKKHGSFTFAVVSSVDAVGEKNNAPIKAGTAFFPSGSAFNRQQDGRHYIVNGYAAYNVTYGSYYYASVARVNYIYNSEDVNISYLPVGSSYHYKRSSNDVSVSYNTTYSYRAISAGLNADDKFYRSNTAGPSKFFLPDVSGFISLPQLFNMFYIKIASAYNLFYSEPAITNSYANYMLTQLAPQYAFTFMPVTEVQGFNNILPIQHNEFTSIIELHYSYKITLGADVFIRNTNRDVYPVVNNQKLLLNNMVNSRANGFELQLDMNDIPRHTRYFSMSNSISFYKFNSKATHVYNGYNNTPIAGFANVYKAIIEGQPLGVIVGSSYARDANNKIVIGANGYPMVNNQPSVIGNPTPDFTLKFSHALNWKSFALNIDWEYTKGGDVWNGTQALLDYYGRSATTAAERNITNYIFNGVQQNGHQNTVPVNFYDANLPVEKNRWVQYGYTGIAEAYIQKADAVRLHNLAVTYTINCKKYLQKIRFMAYMENLLIWSAYKGADANQLLYGQTNSSGLNFFNLPSTKSFGINVSIQF